MKKTFIILILLCGCGPSSLSEFRREGESVALQMAKDLHQVETIGELEEISPKLKKRLNKLTDLMIKAQKYSADAQLDETYGSLQLKKELERIYEIEGGRECFEAICSQAYQKIQLNLD